MLASSLEAALTVMRLPLFSSYSRHCRQAEQGVATYSTRRDRIGLGKHDLAPPCTLLPMTLCASLLKLRVTLLHLLFSYCSVPAA